MSKPSDEAVRKEFEAWATDDEQRGLSAYLPYVIAQEAFSAGFASGRSAAIQECADKLRRLAKARGCDEKFTVIYLGCAESVLALKER